MTGTGARAVGFYLRRSGPRILAKLPAIRKLCQPRGPSMRYCTQLCRAAVTVSLMLLAMGGAAVAGPLEDAGAAFDRRDYATAVRLFRSLADQGDAAAQQRVGLMYEGGLGVLEDYAVAAMWFRRAADQGLKTAQWDLGLMYETGSGVQQNYVQAHMWYNLSAAQGWGVAAVARNKLERAMTPAQIAEAQKLAREWKPR
jgi:TPR repeat protein